MRALSMDLRERIVGSWDEGRLTQREIAQRYVVSVAMVKKLLQLRRRTQSIAPRVRRPRPSLMTPARCRRLCKLVARKPDATLEELRASLRLSCSLSTIHLALVAMKLTYKKRRSTPASKSART